MDARTIEGLRAWNQRLAIAGFLLVLAAPLVDRVLRPSSARDTLVEMRAPAPLPKLPRTRHELSTFPKRFEAWHADTFGLRDVLLRWHNLLRWRVLGTTPTPKLVVGAANWIFSTAGLAMEDHRGVLPMSPGLLAEWQRFLERRRDYLAARGIRYLLVAAPNKDAIYPEHLPAAFAPVGPNRLDQLVEHLARRSDLEVLDLRPALLGEKARDAGEDLTYYPLGTHWTDRGAYAGYCAIVSALGRRASGFEPIPREAFRVERVADPGDSWAGRLYLSGELHQAHYRWTLEERRAHPRDRVERDSDLAFVREDAPGRPRALFLHDSFGLPIRPWLAEHFSELDCFWATDVDAYRLDQVRPDVVIQLYNEATLVRIMPVSTNEEDGARSAERFEASREVVWKMPKGGRPDGIEADAGASISREGGDLVLDAAGADELLYLPEMTYPTGSTLLLRIDLETGDEGILFVFYRTRYDPTYERRRALHRSFGKGRSAVFLVLPPAEETGRLALRLGSMQGRYRLHGIEIRREPD